MMNHVPLVYMATGTQKGRRNIRPGTQEACAQAIARDWWRSRVPASESGPKHQLTSAQCIRVTMAKDIGFYGGDRQITFPLGRPHRERCRIAFAKLS